jgi:2-oxoglutarate ferredoxin oxidoreductase subunit alpha
MNSGWLSGREGGLRVQPPESHRPDEGGIATGVPEIRIFPACLLFTEMNVIFLFFGQVFSMNRNGGEGLVRENEVSVLVGGRAGDGISSAGQIIAELLGQIGYRVHMYLDYPSRIKGGHNFAIIRGAEQTPGAVRMSVDFILALNQETLDLHRSRLSSDGVMIYDADSAGKNDGTGVKIREILAQENAPPVMGNSAIIGAFAGAAGIDWHTVETVFRKTIPRDVQKNLRVARRGFDAAEPRSRVAPLPNTPVPVCTGNEAIGLGLVRGGLQTYFAYPMSPTSNLLHFLAGHEEEFRIRVFQPESEIAVILMALGCSYTGSRAAVGTSGGGFCLMTEAISLAGIAELPVVIVLGQRTGPSTGLATYTAQADLHFALNAGHGEFPRLVAAPGNAEEAMTWATHCMNLSWKYQTPAILLPDKIICEGMYSLDPGNVPRVQAEPDLAGTPPHPYDRYTLTSTGISPLLFPPLHDSVIRVNSHVHDPDGITTEDPEVTRAMADKLQRKERLLRADIEDLHPVTIAGNPRSTTAILCWGSCKGICTELGSRMGLRVIQPIVLSPFPEKSFADAMEGVERIIAVEENQTGQLARLVRQFGYHTSGTVLKYDGRPFTVEELEDEIRKVVV